MILGGGYGATECQSKGEATVVTGERGPWLGFQAVGAKARRYVASVKVEGSPEAWIIASRQSLHARVLAEELGFPASLRGHPGIGGRSVVGIRMVRRWKDMVQPTGGPRQRAQ